MTAGPAEPRILAFDTATELCSVALLGARGLAVVSEEAGAGASQRLLPMIDGLLTAAGLGLRELDAIAFGRGPGAFTGVRLAASVAQGLAFGAQRRVVPVSDLLALAARGFELEPLATRVLVCSDARMREVYWALYERTPDGSARALGSERVGRPESVTIEGDAGRTVGIGRGFLVYPALYERFQSRLAAVHGTERPHAREIAVLAVREWGAGRTWAPSEALPVYVRDEVARPKE